MEALLNAFARFIALIERTGNALGTLAFVWASVVVLGGFPDHLGDDFWVATAIVFLEAFRYPPISWKSAAFPSCGRCLYRPSNQISSALLICLYFFSY
jgi:hypothetical protein